MILSIQKPNLRLYFDGDSQRLTIIEQVAPISHTEYKGTTLASLASSGDIKRSLQRVFGATSAPQKHPEYSKEIMLCYPGVGFGISTGKIVFSRVFACSMGRVRQIIKHYNVYLLQRWPKVTLRPSAPSFSHHWMYCLSRGKAFLQLKR